MDSGIKNQFLESYKENADAIFRFCFIKVSDREMAKDLTQETFTKAWLYLSKGNKVGNMKAFLFTTARNLVIDEYRKKKTTSLDNLSEQGFDVGIDNSDSLIDSIDGEQALGLLANIPEKYRDAIYMHYVEGLGIGEIAKITGETENNISVRIHRGLQKLRSVLREQI